VSTHDLWQAVLYRRPPADRAVAHRFGYRRRPLATLVVVWLGLELVVG
jgi:hypothetical protein